jgi:AraC-like DNA-binding protein
MIDNARIAVSRSGRVALLQLGMPIVEHAHPQAHVLLKFDGPDGAFLVDGVECPLTDDRVVLVDPWVSHAGIPGPGQSATRILALYIDIAAGAASMRRPSRRFAGASAPLDSALRQSADRVARRLLDETVNEDDVERLFAAVDGHYRRVPCDNSGTAVDFRIRRVIARIREDPDLALDADACASLAGLSRSRFFELFRQSTGVSPRLYWNALRLDNAINDLCASSTPIKALSEELGFSAPAHFTRFFQHHLGSSPRALRRGACGFHPRAGR